MEILLNEVGLEIRNIITPAGAPPGGESLIEVVKQ